MSKQALYLTVYGILKQEITEGHLKVGTLLPSEQELEAQFKVSRTTIRKAIGLLKDEGYLDVRQGRGTTVQDITTTQISCIFPLSPKRCATMGMRFLSGACLSLKSKPQIPFLIILCLVHRCTIWNVSCVPMVCPSIILRPICWQN